MLCQPVEVKGDLFERLIYKYVLLASCFISYVITKEIKYITMSNQQNETTNIYNKDHITVATLNVNSLNLKTDEVKEFIIKQDVDIMCIQETHIMEEENYIYV